jgi:hypothetical protein
MLLEKVVISKACGSDGIGNKILKLRDGPFDFSWGRGANPKKYIEHVLN